MEDVRVNATYGQIEDFKSSVLWNDIVSELEAWKHGFELEMKSMTDDAAESNPSTAAFLLHMGDINGRIKAVDYMVSILDVFMQILETKKELKEEEEEDE